MRSDQHLAGDHGTHPAAQMRGMGPYIHVSQWRRDQMHIRALKYAPATRVPASRGNPAGKHGRVAQRQHSWSVAARGGMGRGGAHTGNVVGPAAGRARLPLCSCSYCSRRRRRSNAPGQLGSVQRARHEKRVVAVEYHGRVAVARGPMSRCRDRLSTVESSHDPLSSPSLAHARVRCTHWSTYLVSLLRLEVCERRSGLGLCGVHGVEDVL